VTTDPDAAKKIGMDEERVCVDEEDDEATDVTEYVTRNWILCWLAIKIPNVLDCPVGLRDTTARHLLDARAMAETPRNQSSSWAFV
jgi:hypothetical protein